MKFVIECEMKDRWAPHFLGMLLEMERLGRIGASRTVAMYADGDGDFRPRFKIGGFSLDSASCPTPASPIIGDGTSSENPILFDAG